MTFETAYTLISVNAGQKGGRLHIPSIRSSNIIPDETHRTPTLETFKQCPTSQQQNLASSNPRPSQQAQIHCLQDALAAKKAVRLHPFRWTYDGGGCH